MERGYYLQPDLHGETIAFFSDEALWAVPARGGVARRLTHTGGVTARPRFSPDGGRLAYAGVEEGYPEVYVMPAEGGPGRRLTRLSSQTSVLGWTPDGRRIVFATLRGQTNRRLLSVFTVDADGGRPEPLPVGPAVAVAFGPGGETVICRGSGMDPSWWKRYRGGRIGELWIDRTGEGAFEKLLVTGGNLAHPVWAGDRLYFHSDHEGMGNLYSCTAEGGDLQRHTDMREHYLRQPSGDGRRIVFTAGGDLHLFDPADGSAAPVEVTFPSQKDRRARRFVPAERFLEDYALHPEGHSLCLTARGKPFTLAHWEGAVRQYGVADGSARYRLARWLADGERIVAVSDEGGEEALEVYDDGGERLFRLDGLDVGRPVDLAVSPAADAVALSNHRGELWWVDLETWKARLLQGSRHGRILGFDISPSGRYVAYGLPLSQKTAAVHLFDLETGERHLAAESVLKDVRPSFDPDGRYLYFLSYSGFDPVRDVLDFSYGFPRGVQVKLVTLRRDLPSPFVPEPRAPGEGPAPAGSAPGGPKPGEGEDDDAPEEPADETVDVEGLARRVITFPVEVGDYTRVQGLPGGKVLLQSSPVKGLMGRTWLPSEPDADDALLLFDFRKGKAEPLIKGVTDFTVCPRRKVLAYRSGRKLRVLAAGAAPPEDKPGPPARANGWIDLGRVRLSVHPAREWRQMFREAWRLLRDHYYAEDMAGCDWDRVWERYAPLVDRVSTRRELSDLFWEMGGELGTSHAYELGGDYPPLRRYPQGFLGADLAFAGGAWRIERIVEGDPGVDGHVSPLEAPGVLAAPGDVIEAVNGRVLTESFTPDEALVNLGRQWVELRLSRDGETRTATVRTLASEMPLRHREWVRRNTERVHRETGGRAGYVHISDMGPQGFSEFHRAFLSEVERSALIVDVRFNAGGHVSPLILQRLLRRRTGYGVSRWTEPYPRPPDTVAGPLVALTDEFSGSDGDVFSHNWKQLGVGPLIGKRTWGGIVGLHPTHPLVDGTVTTQPEFFNWFFDVGFGLENHGAEPDIEVEIPPQDYVAGRDPQLDKAIEVVLDLWEKNPPASPSLEPRPRRPLPT